jgi:hypothetical protein
MRLALVSLIALAAAATNAVAQPAPDAPAASPAPAAATPAPAPAPAAPAAAPAPAAATTPAPAPTGAPASGPASPPPAAPATPAAAAPADTPAATDTEAPPPPPAPPTDPTAIGVMSVLTNVCIPSANGGNLAQLAKTNGFRKGGNNSWTLRQKDYSLVIEDPGANPNQCHVDVTHPIDQDAPGKTIVIALHDWAQTTNGWSLYRNDKSVQAGLEYTTRSWEHQANGKAEGLDFITQRHPDGTPMQRTSDTSQLIYSQTKAAS